MNGLVDDPEGASPTGPIKVRTRFSSRTEKRLLELGKTSDNDL